MRRTLRTVLMMAATLVPLSNAVASSEIWSSVQQALSTENAETLEARLELLQDEALHLGVERSSPYARALSHWAAQHPGQLGELARSAAEELDPRLPHPVLLAARWHWQDGHRLRAAAEYLRGLIRSLQYERTRHAVAVSGGLWILSSFVVAALVFMVVVVVHCLRRLVADAVRMGRSILRPANAVVFAIAILALPLLGGLGPLWWLAYLFVLTWCYLEIEGRVVAVATTFVLAAAVPLALAWQGEMLRSVKVTREVAQLLDQRSLDLSVLRDFADAEEFFRGNGEGHLILGELFRMHGEPGRARLQFQLAAGAGAGDSRANVFLGNLALEDGDVAKAISFYSAATTADPKLALAYHNLSSAYDQSRRFQEGDEARRRARELAGGPTDELGVGGGESRLRYPRLDREDVERFEGSLTPEQRFSLGLEPPKLRWWSLLAERSSLVFSLSGLVGCVVLALRLRLLTASRSCVKCGNVYRMGSGSGEAQRYCSQCVSVFLKRDLVSIEQQTQKMRQVRRWERREKLGRRIGALVAPGSGQVLAGRASAGMLVGIVSWWLLIGALVWLPRTLSAAEPELVAMPIQVLLLALWLGVWGRSVLVAWSRS